MRKKLYLETLLDDINSNPWDTKGPYKIYVDTSKEGIPIYRPRIDIKYLQYLPLLRELYKKHPNKKDIDEIGRNITFGRVYEVLKENIMQDLSNIDSYAVDEEEIREISELLTWEVTSLTRVAPFLLDNNIEEIFIDGIETPIYLNHSKFGRCISDIKLTKEEIEALITHTELHKGISINYSRGNIESEIGFGDSLFRINIDLDPLAVRGPYIIIRNLRKKLFTLPKLIENRTLTLDAATFILIAGWTKLSITIAGEVNSGKTTLLNAIDIALPKRFRKIYIEDAIESIDMRRDGRFQAFYRAEAYSDTINKRRQLTFTLHRTPDIIIFGEILTDDDVTTLFYSLSCGLKSLHTIHAGSIERLIRRLVLHHNISVESLRDLDLIVIMKRSHYGRRYVEGIYEIEVYGDNVEASPIYKYGDKTLVRKIDIWDTITGKKIIDTLEGEEKAQDLYSSLMEALRITRTDTFLNKLREIENELYRENSILIRRI
jgi:type IV secretory pathway ATPase VirB11/archaellum biosynthesis ATPase